jgi:hypothetical protein
MASKVARRQTHTLRVSLVFWPKDIGYHLPLCKLDYTFKLEVPAGLEVEEHVCLGDEDATNGSKVGCLPLGGILQAINSAYGDEGRDIGATAPAASYKTRSTPKPYAYRQGRAAAELQSGVDLLRIVSGSEHSSASQIDRMESQNAYILQL